MKSLTNMKHTLLLVIVVLSLTTDIPAQGSETFDIATFIPPKGWSRQANQSSVQFSTENKATGEACLMTVFRSTPGVGTSRENFDAAWETLVKGSMNVTAPQMQPTLDLVEWKVETGAAPFTTDGSKGVAMLVTVSGHGTMMNALILANGASYESVITSFLDSFTLKKPALTAANTSPAGSPTSGIKDGYAFSTTNFDDGWSSFVRSDWVETVKGDTVVLLHYGITITTEMRRDIPNTYWNQIAAPRYTIRNLYPTDYEQRVVQADGIDKATGKKIFVTFQVISKNGTAYCYEIVTPTKESFTRQFPAMNDLEKLSGYNRFAVGKNDLIGNWQAGDGAFTQYYFVSSGNYAGMNITVSNLKYSFMNGTSYKQEYQAVNNGVYAAENSAGKYTVSNWDVTTTDQQGKVSDFAAWFEATKGGRILHLHNKKFSGQHYRLGRYK